MKMQKLQFIKQFEVKNAHYQLEDGDGDIVQLAVDYKNNTYQLDPPSQLNENFEQEVHQVARGLLQRKHGVNLAEREQYV